MDLTEDQWKVISDILPKDQGSCTTRLCTANYFSPPRCLTADCYRSESAIWSAIFSGP